MYLHHQPRSHKVIFCVPLRQQELSVTADMTSVTHNSQNPPMIQFVLAAYPISVVVAIYAVPSYTILNRNYPPPLAE